jgi:anti-sigma B factor antagonist
LSAVRVEVQGHGDAIRIALDGDVDLSNAKGVEADLASAITNHTSEVALDLGQVGYLDSVGLRVLYSLAASLRRSQVKLRIVAPPRSPARRAIEVSGMSTIAVIEPAASD